LGHRTIVKREAGPWFYCGRVLRGIATKGEGAEEGGSEEAIFFDSSG